MKKVVLIASRGKDGKRAIRIYPPWNMVKSSQALKTQAWQHKYFIEIHSNKPIDKDKIKKLFSSVCN